MNLVDALLGEHAAILTLCDSIEKALSTWDLNQLRVAASLLEETLKRHAVLEDELLFDPLETDKPGLKDTLASMRAEHEVLRDSMEQLDAADNLRVARRLMQEVIDVARDHFAIEERVLFSIAADQVGRRTLERLGAEWAARRNLSLVIPAAKR
jgi:hemerythrin-like domain-containing protein